MSSGPRCAPSMPGTPPGMSDPERSRKSFQQLVCGLGGGWEKNQRVGFSGCRITRVDSSVKEKPWNQRPSPFYTPACNLSTPRITPVLRTPAWRRVRWKTPESERLGRDEKQRLSKCDSWTTASSLPQNLLKDTYSQATNRPTESETLGSQPGF